MYKKVYVEITNNCNLNCDFCIKNHRRKKFMTVDEFQQILNKLNGYTNHLYFHILGEPLLHPQINEFIDIASKNYQINITTNGYLIDRIKKNHNIRQINISLHSYDENYSISLENYMNNIFAAIDNLKQNTYISMRFWVDNKYTNKMLELINQYFQSNIIINNQQKNYCVDKNVFLNVSEEFTWPSLDNDYYSEVGSCLALKHHIGILVDGTIVPCCLDSKGDIPLGNIFFDDLQEVISSEKYKKMITGFNCNQKIEFLCKKCPVKRNLNG